LASLSWVEKWVSVGSMVLGVLAFLWNVWNWFEGAEVNLFSPDQVTIARSDQVSYPMRGEAPYVLFILKMSYTNEGAPQYSSVVRRERLVLELPGRNPVEHHWFRVVSADIGKQGDKLVVNRLHESRPFPVQAGSATSHETLFQPWPHKCPEERQDCNPRKNYL